MSATEPQLIGVFDSGLGGLTVVKALKQTLPDKSLIYYGDTARTPYGSKSVETIKRFAKEVVSFLLSQGAQMIVIACNTVSATVLRDLEALYPNIPFVGTIQPMVSQLKSSCQLGEKVAVIATRVTVNSQVYPHNLLAGRPDLQVVQKACPLFVPLIEEGVIQHPLMEETIHYSLDEFMAENSPDKLVLGCTHYPLIRQTLEQFYPTVQIVDPAHAMAETCQKILIQSSEQPGQPEESAVFDRYYASDLSPNFVEMIRKIIGEGNSEIRFRRLG